MEGKERLSPWRYPRQYWLWDHGSEQYFVFQGLDRGRVHSRLFLGCIMEAMGIGWPLGYLGGDFCAL